jgi:hypothetical protein
MKFKYIMGASVTGLRLYFHSLCQLSAHFFSPLPEMLYASCIKFFAEALELFMHAVFHLFVIHKTASLDFIFQGPKNMEVGGC